MRPASRLLLFLAAAGFATPAMASDFTPLRIMLLGGYGLISLTFFGLLWLLIRARATADWRRWLIAIVGAGLFAPTLMPGPNFFWPAAIFLIIGYPEYIGLPTLASAVLVGGAIWLLAGRVFVRRRAPNDAAG